MYVCVCVGMCVHAAQVSIFYMLQYSDKEMRVYIDGTTYTNPGYFNCQFVQIT